MIILFAIVIILTLWFSKYVLDLQAFNAKLKDFTCPPQRFLFGHLPELAKDVLGTVLEYNKKYGKLLHLNATYFAPILMISDRDLIKEVMTSSNAINKGKIYEVFHNTAQDALPLAADKRWQGMRKLLNPAFTIQTLPKSMNTFNSVASILADKLGMYGDKEIEVSPLLELCTLDSTFESLLGSKINSQLNEFNNFNVFTGKMLEIFRKKLFSPWTLVPFIYVFTPTYWRESRLTNAITQETLGIIKARRKEIEAGDENEKFPFLDTMLKGTIPGRILTDVDIANELTAFIFASRDTTGSTVASALHLLAHYPEYQNRIFEELQTIFTDDFMRPVTSDDLREMKFLEAFLKETMRMYPALPFIARNLQKDETYNGVFIPAGINLIICIHAMHNSEEYFPNANVFNPDRFYGDKVTNIKPFSFIPFSAGFRNCIGQRHGMSGLKIIITHILRRHQLLPVGDKKLDMFVKLTITSKTPIKIRIKPRMT